MRGNAEHTGANLLPCNAADRLQLVSPIRCIMEKSYVDEVMRYM